MSKKSIKVHYPLIVASAYSGYVIWHMGYSSSAALFVASENHSLIDKIGILPVTETIFSSFNIFMALVTLLTITIIAPLMRPKDSKTIIEVDAKKLFKKEEKGIKRISSVAEIIENNRKISFLFGFVILFFILNTFYEKGFFLDLNLVSWTFLCVGLMLSNSSIHYVRLINNAAPTVGPIILQYPFYHKKIPSILFDHLIFELFLCFFLSIVGGKLSLLFCNCIYFCFFKRN